MNRKQLVMIVLLAALLFIIGCAQQQTSDDYPELETTGTINDEIDFLEDGTPYLLHPDNIRRGIARPGDIKDAIPSIDNPKFVSVSDADNWIEDNELVLALDYKGEKRVYPLQILVWHEIVNDEVADDPLAITYCPLCGSGIAYQRQINIDGEEQATTFGTSGKLYNSNLIMYDRTTESYWTQIDGLAVLGELTGQELQEISIDTVSWREWKKEHPNSLVLSQETGHSRSYGRDPYGSYYENSNLFFPVTDQDNRIHPKDVIFGIELNEQFKAYREVDIKRLGSIVDQFAGTTLSISRGRDGKVTIIDTQTQEEIVKERDFWFAWYAFHPQTQLYEQEQ